MRHLRTILDVEGRAPVEALLRRAQALKRARRDRRLAPTLAGRVIGLVFERESTRTRMSMEAGVKLLGGSTIALHARDTQIVQGELIRDVARVLGGYVDLFVTRTRVHSTVEEYARHAGIPVVNALSDVDHPCQVLTDLFTVYERREDPFGLTWVWVGDATPHMNGLVGAAAMLGFPLRLSFPRDANIPPPFTRLREEAPNILRFEDPREAVSGADVIVTGPPLGLDEPDPRYRLDAALVAHANDDHFVLHALPARRGREITDDVLEGPRGLAFEGAKNRLPVQQAILEWLLDIPPEAR